MSLQKELKSRAIGILMALFILPFASGCASIVEDIIDDSVPVEYSFQANQFVLPEANGRFLHGKAQIYTAGSGTATLIDDIDSTTYSTSPTLKSTNEFGALIDLGLLSRLDIFSREGFGAKVQILGAPRAEAKKGNVSLSIAYMSRSFDIEKDTEDTTGSVKKAESKTKSTGDQYMLIYGQRTTDNVVLYGGAFYAKSSARVYLMQTNNTNFTDTGYPTKGEGESYGGNVGLFYENPAQWFDALGYSLGLEVAYSHTTWKKTDSPVEDADPQNSIYGGGIIGLTW